MNNCGSTCYNTISGIDQLYNKDIYANSYVGTSSSTIQPPEPTLDSLLTMNPHPLARYSTPNKYLQGYADPSFSGGEYTRGLSFRDHEARSILTSSKHESQQLIDTISPTKFTKSSMSGINDPQSMFQTISDIDSDNKLLQLITNSDEQTSRLNELNKPTISPLIGNAPKGSIPLYLEVPPHITREPFNFSLNGGPNGIPQIEMTTSEYNSFINAFNNYDTNGPIDMNKELKLIIPPNSGNQPCQLSNHERFKNNLSNYFPESFSHKSSHQITSQSIEPFNSDISAPASNTYLDALKTRAIAVCFYLQNNASYKNWRDNWQFLDENLKKSKLLFERLDTSDADIAYVINKGEEVKFRIRDEKRFIPLNIYQYVLYHEMAHMSTHELQHTPKFHELLNIITLAGFELGFIDLSRVAKSFYMTNNQPILCKASLREEIVEGCNWLIHANPNSKDYFNEIIRYVNSK